MNSRFEAGVGVILFVLVIGAVILRLLTSCYDGDPGYGLPDPGIVEVRTGDSGPG